MKSLEQRVQRLENNNRRLMLAGIAVLLAAAGALLMGGGKKRGGVWDEIRAKQFVVVDGHLSGPRPGCGSSATGRP